MLQTENEEEQKKRKAEAEAICALTAASAVPETSEAAVSSEQDDLSDPTFAIVSQKTSKNQKQQSSVTFIPSLDGKVAGVSTARPAAGTTRRISGVGDRNDL